MKRRVEPTIPNCPVEGFMTLENCRKCPHHRNYSKHFGEVDCEMRTEREKKMAEEPARMSEWKVKW